MKINQKSHIEIEKDGKLVALVCDSDLSLGLIFDALMEMKGWVCDKMIAAHQEEAAEAERQMGSPEALEEVEQQEESKE